MMKQIAGILFLLWLAAATACSPKANPQEKMVGFWSTPDGAQFDMRLEILKGADGFVLMDTEKDKREGTLLPEKDRFVLKSDKKPMMDERAEFQYLPESDQLKLTLSAKTRQGEKSESILLSRTVKDDPSRPSPRKIEGEVVNLLGDLRTSQIAYRDDIGAGNGKFASSLAELKWQPPADSPAAALFDFSTDSTGKSMAQAKPGAQVRHAVLVLDQNGALSYP